MTRFGKSAVTAIVAILCMALPALASPQDQVRQLVAQFASHNTEPSIGRAVNSNIDFATIVSRSFEPSEWQSFTPVQQKQLIDSFARYISARYYMRWHKIFDKSQLSFGDEARTARGTYVRTFVKHGKQEDTVVWTLNSSNQVVDLTVNGKDLIERLGQTAQPQLQKRGASQFVTWMKDQAVTAQKRQGEAEANASTREPM